MSYQLSSAQENSKLIYINSREFNWNSITNLLSIRTNKIRIKIDITIIFIYNVFLDNYNETLNNITL